MRLFWTVRSSSVIVYIGCIATLLALAFEPFSQQLLHYAQRAVAYPDRNSSVSYSTAYDFQSHGVDGASAVIGRHFSSLCLYSTF